MTSSLLGRLLRALRPRARSTGAAAPTAGRTAPPARAGVAAPSRHVALPDHVGPVATQYAPRADGRADPGEIVWTWVPFEDDPARGKDRPVLVVGHDGSALLALMLTSKDHDRDAAREARRGRTWMDVGAGPWDARRRPSEVRLDRVLRLDPDEVRREGATLDRALFDRVVAGMRAARGD